jgi:hypothetical protein
MPRLRPLALGIALGWAFGLPVHAETPPARLVVHPAAIDLVGLAARHRILVTAVAADGSQVDATAQARFTSSAAEVVAVSAAGECQPLADGKAIVRVDFAGKSAEVPVAVSHAKAPRPPSFVNDVTPIFTRFGCNQGACHGKGAGQNGFRLSLRGYAPEMDYDWITREYLGRRIDPTTPENSLLLLKPLGAAPHEGGALFGRSSREYGVLLDWLQARTPGPAKDDPEVRRLEILPGNRLLKVGEEQQLLVRAEFSDGEIRDATWLTKFDSNDAGVVEVTPNGKARALLHGETAVRATFQGQVAVVIFTIPYDRPIQADRLAGRNNFIDEHVFGKLGGLRIEPSDLCDDATFLRRAYLDAIGALPTPAEVRAFLADKAADKRSRLIDRLLERPEFVDFWAVQLGDLLQNRKERDHDVRGAKGVRSFHEWIRAQVAANRPWDEIAREVLTTKGKVTDNPAIGYFITTVGETQDADQSEVVASVAQAFLGTRIGCAKCHNHPLEKYTQDDYYHFAAYFSRVRLDRKDPKQGATVLRVAARDANQEKNPIGVRQPRTGQFLAPQPLDRSPTPLEPGDDPRAKLADWMTDPKNEYFSGAMVNRLWRHFMGTGLVEPVDDLRASNPPTNPELWRALHQEFVGHKFDMKHMMRVILNSRAYQLSSATNPSNAADTRFYSHYNARRLPAEVLLDGLAQVTEVPDAFAGYPTGLRSVQLPEPGPRSYFLSLFGRSERVTACACERSGEVTLPQLLHMENGQTVVQKIAAPDGRLAKMLKAGDADDKVVAELFLATLCRPPTEPELAVVRKQMAPDKREEVLRDLFWALVNSKEFAFNH